MRALVLATLLLAACSAEDPSETVTEAPAPASESGQATTSEPRRIIKKSGLVIDILEEGRGAPVRTGDWITVHYEGWVLGTEDIFDGTRGSGVPYTTQLRSGKVIDGWVDGLVGQRVGTTLRLEIPSKLAYGDRGNSQVDIPGGTDLGFEIEIVNTSARRKRR